VGVGEPVQVPVVEVNVWPTVTVPDITGATVLIGIQMTAPSELEVAETAPAVFVAVTVQVIIAPASALTSRYVLDVALPMLTPSRFH
jgi:hypothetical protein